MRGPFGTDPLLCLVNDITAQVSFSTLWKSWMETKREGTIDEDKVIYMSIMLWHIWNDRNKYYLGILFHN